MKPFWQQQQEAMRQQQEQQHRMHMAAAWMEQQAKTGQTPAKLAIPRKQHRWFSSFGVLVLGFILTAVSGAAARIAMTPYIRGGHQDASQLLAYGCVAAVLVGGLILTVRATRTVWRRE